jgi:hypothetical protein
LSDDKIIREPRKVPRKCCIQRKDAMELLQAIIELDDNGQLHRDPLDTDSVFNRIRVLIGKSL